jgi:hypothetical protein
VITVIWTESGVDDAGRTIEEVVDFREFAAGAEGQQCASALAARWTRRASSPQCVTITASAAA